MESAGPGLSPEQPAVCLWVSETWLRREMLKPEGRLLARKAQGRVWVQVIFLVTVSHQKMASVTTNPREKPYQKNTQGSPIAVIAW